MTFEDSKVDDLKEKIDHLGMPAHLGRTEALVEETQEDLYELLENAAITARGGDVTSLQEFKEGLEIEEKVREIESKSADVQDKYKETLKRIDRILAVVEQLSDKDWPDAGRINEDNLEAVLSPSYYHISADESDVLDDADCLTANDISRWKIGPIELKDGDGNRQDVKIGGVGNKTIDDSTSSFPFEEDLEWHHEDGSVSNIGTLKVTKDNVKVSISEYEDLEAGDIEKILVPHIPFLDIDESKVCTQYMWHIDLGEEPEDDEDDEEDGDGGGGDGGDGDGPEDGPEDGDEEDEDRERFENGFDREYAKLEGDEMVGNTGPEEGHVIFAKDSVSTWPGGNSDWIKLEVIDLNDEQVKIMFTGHTEKDARNFIGETTTLDRTREGFNKLKKLAKGELYKYRKISDKKDFFESVKKGGGVSMGEQWEGTTSDAKKTYRLDGKDKTEKITHVAVLPEQIAPTQRQRSIYEVEWKGGFVHLKGYITKEEDKDGNPTKQEVVYQKMDYTSFIHFCKDKDLKPYTKNEIDNSGKFQRPDAKSDPKFNNWRDKFVSINTLIKTFKKFPETFKSKWEQESKLQSTEMFNRLLQSLPKNADGGRLYLRDMADDAKAEADATVMQIINDYKERLGRNDIGEGIHGGKGTKIIAAQIFERNISLRTDRLKAAGYLLYALENAGQPYPRKIQQFAGRGLWIKKILGEKHQKAFQKEQQELIDKLYTGGGDMASEELQDRLTKLELHYLKDKSTDHPFYGSRFGREVEKHMNNWGKFDALENVKSGIAGKGNFYDIYEAHLKGGLGNMLPHVFMGSLLALEEEVVNDDQYKVFYQVIVNALASGYTKHLSRDYMRKFKAVCRRRGIPIGMFVDDPGSMTKSVGLIDYIAKKRGMDSLYDTIKSKTGGAWDPRDDEFKGRDKMDLTNVNFGMNHKYDKKMCEKVMGIVGDWWGHNGEVIMSEFNSNPETLLEGVAEENYYVTEYFSDKAVFDEYRDYKDTRGTEMGDGDNPFYDGIFNLDPGTFESYMLRYNGRDFNASQSGDMWQKLEVSLTNFQGVMERMPAKKKIPLLRVLLKKWKMYFGKKLGDEGLRYMRKQLLQQGRVGTYNQAQKNLNILNEITFQNSYEYELDSETLELKKRKQGANYRPPEAPPILKQTIRLYKDIIVEGFKDLDDPSNDITDSQKAELVNDAFGDID